MNDETNSYEGFAVLELMGHRRLIGRISDATIAGAPMLRIDVLTTSGETTQYYSGASIYAITPISEETARRAASLSTVAPITRWELPALPAARQSDDDRAADVADFLTHYASGDLVIDNTNVRARLDQSVAWAANVRAEEQDDTGDLADSSNPY